MRKFLKTVCISMVVLGLIAGGAFAESVFIY